MIILSILGVITLCLFIYTVRCKERTRKESNIILDNPEPKIEYDYSVDFDEGDNITPFRLTNQGLEDYAETGFVEALKEYIAKQDGEEVITESKKLEEDDADYTKLKETVKTEMYKYLKTNGIDIDHLIKSGVELDTMKPVIDKMLDTYVATSIADYENQFNKGLSWDYDIKNNDIIISIEDM